MMLWGAVGVILGTVGSRLSDSWGRGGHGSAKLLLSSRGLSMLLTLDCPSETELEAHTNGQLLLAACRATKHVLLLLYRSAGLTQGWRWVPYAAAQDLRGCNCLLARRADDPQPWQLSCGLADCRDDTLSAVRTGTLSRDFAAMLRAHLVRMVALSPDYSRALYLREMDAIGYQWRDDEAVLASAEPITESRAIEELGP